MTPSEPRRRKIGFLVKKRAEKTAGQKSALGAKDIDQQKPR